MLGKTRWLALTLVVALATVGVGVTATADSGSENSFLSAINSTRSSAGLGSLTMHGGLQSHAREHSADMVAAGDIYHSSSGELQSAAGSGWSKLGENVGRGGSVSSLHKAFLNSPSHNANIHGDYTHVGIGTATSSDGVLYVTVVFMKKGQTTTTTTAPPATTTTTVAATATPTTAPAKSGGSNAKQPVTKSPADSTPAETTTTTTLPPTTTTTLVVPPDKPVTPGESCYTVTRFWWMCHD